MKCIIIKTEDNMFIHIYVVISHIAII